MWNASLDESQAGNKITGRNINNLRYADNTALMAECEEELKSFFMKMKEKSEKSGLKHIIQKTKIMASCPITSWQRDGDKVETVTDFIILGSKITADGPWGQEIKRSLHLLKTVMTNLESILKGSNFTLLTRVHIVKAMVFAVVGYECDSWAIKKTESQRMGAF